MKVDPARLQLRSFYTPKMYLEHVRMLKTRYEKDPDYGKPIDPLVFAAACLRMPVDEARASIEVPWFKAHHSVAQSILETEKRQFVNPVIINAGILEQRGNPKYRMGDVGPADGTPPARHARELLALWVKMTERGIKDHQHATKEMRWLFSTMMHDAFNCLQPFAEGNWRTNWYQLQTCRRALGLPHIMWRYDDAEERDTRVDVYRWVYFVPWMRDHGYV